MPAWRAITASTVSPFRGMALGGSQVQAFTWSVATQRPRIIAFAYACAPGRGSEPGAGWIWSRMLAHVGEVHVVTRTHYRNSLEAAARRLPSSERPTFHFVDVEPLGSWCKDSQGLRTYYPIWQAAAVRLARQLHRSEPFDLAWHLTWANAWMGTLAPLVDVPFVYGPVGGGVGFPWRLAGELGARGTAYELARSAGRGVGRHLNPMARLGWRRASLILTQNRETVDWLPSRHRDKAHVFPNVTLDTPGHRRVVARDRAPTALFAGHLRPLKGVTLALRAIAALPEWQLLICGTGSDELRLRRLAESLGTEERVTFKGWLDRTELGRVMTEDADVFLFPSLHDEGSWVVAEALHHDMPIVCLDLGGPAVLAQGFGFAVDPNRPRDAVVADLASATERAFHERSNGSKSVRDFGLQSQVSALEELLEEARLLSSGKALSRAAAP